MSNLPEYIFDFVEQYAFTDLSTAEQQRVLYHITEETYNELHFSATLFKTANKPVFTIKNNKEALLKSMGKNKPATIWPWQLAASILLGSTLFFALKKSPVKIITKIKTTTDSFAVPYIVHQKDTLIIQKPIIQYITKTKVVTKKNSNATIKNRDNTLPVLPTETPSYQLQVNNNNFNADALKTDSALDKIGFQNNGLDYLGF